MASTGCHVLQYKYRGSWRFAIFTHSTQAREWGEYCFYQVEGVTEVKIIDLSTGKIHWALPTTIDTDWNHNER